MSRTGLASRLFAMLVATFAAACASVQTEYLHASLAAPRTASARPAFTYPIVLESGSATELGEEHGHALGADVRYLHDAYLSQFIRNKSQSLMAGMMATLFQPYVVPEHLVEIAALARSTDITEQETLLGQCFLDLTQMTGCSTVALPASACRDGVARMGRNLDFWSLGVADRYTRVFVVRPTDGRYAFVSIGWPGMIGVLSGMNEFGLTVANMEVPRAIRLPQAMPYPLLYRRLLERCRSVPEAIALLRRTPIQTANNLMLMDAKGNRAVLELSPPGSVVVREGLAGQALLSTNHQRGVDQDSPGRCWRYDLMHEKSAEEFGRFDPDSIEQMMHAVGGNSTLQSIVFEPSTLRMYLAAGQGATARPYELIDLGPLFRGEVPNGVTVLTAAR